MAYDVIKDKPKPVKIQYEMTGGSAGGNGFAMPPVLVPKRTKETAK